VAGSKSSEMLITATIGKFKVICSLLPVGDEKTATKHLKVPDLDMLFALH